MKKISLETKLNVAKQATKLVVGYGTGIIVTGAIINQAMPKNTPQRIAVVIAGTVIAMAARETMGKYTDTKFDETVAYVKDALAKANEKDQETINTVEA